MTKDAAATFSGLVDLAAAALGGRALGTNDDFFAGIENLIQPGRGVLNDEYTDRGKWMDGWESRRKRTPGYDWCVLALGAPGEAVGFDIDTHGFVGNHPPFASVDGLAVPGSATVEELQARTDWVELLAQAPLRPGAQNLFGALPRGPVTHVRLNIFPDGGVARFRVFGRVAPDWTAAAATAARDDETGARVPAGLVDLAAVKNGGVALACSDAHFGPMNNLLLPGRSVNMGGGWETRRRRGPGHDWILIKLGARGAPAVLEVDTNHFKGNFPDRCAIAAIDAGAGSAARITDLIARGDWRTILPETKLGAHARHFFEVTGGPATHLRLEIFPDGGVSRLRAWGTLA
jgi:allantoicase